MLDQVATVYSGARRLYSNPIFDWGENDFKFNVEMSAPVVNVDDTVTAEFVNANRINGYSFGSPLVLWSGAHYMTEGQDITLSQNISSMPHGIVLIFSRYMDGAAADQQFNFHFVPKIMVQLHEGKGSTFELSTANETYRSNKYLYISNNHIKGHANNIASGTGATGVKYTNNAFVLRYVIGV